MDPNLSELPTPPSVPIPREPSANRPIWPIPSARSGPPGQRPPWPLYTAIGALLAVVLIIGFLYFTQGGTTTIIEGSSASLTATASSAQSTASASIRSSETAGHTAKPTPTSTAATPSQHPSVELISAQATVSTGTPVVARCHSGEVALSGGWATNGSTPIYNSDHSGSSWRVFPLSTGGALTNAYVICLKNDPGAFVTTRVAHVTIGAGTTGNGSVACESDEVVVGGGYANPDSGIEIYNFTGMGNGWGGYAVNHSTASDSVTFYAECLTSPLHPQVNFTSPASTTINGGASGGTQVSCPSGSLLSGGGFADSENALVFTSSPDSSSTWEADLQNNGTTPNMLNVFAVCLSFS
jgi:hypothetical protein